MKLIMASFNAERRWPHLFDRLCSKTLDKLYIILVYMIIKKNYGKRPRSYHNMQATARHFGEYLCPPNAYLSSTTWFFCNFGSTLWTPKKWSVGAKLDGTAATGPISGHQLGCQTPGGVSPNFLSSCLPPAGCLVGETPPPDGPKCDMMTSWRKDMIVGEIA